MGIYSDGRKLCITQEEKNEESLIQIQDEDKKKKPIIKILKERGIKVISKYIDFMCKFPTEELKNSLFVEKHLKELKEEFDIEEEPDTDPKALKF